MGLCLSRPAGVEQKFSTEVCAAGPISASCSKGKYDPSLESGNNTCQQKQVPSCSKAAVTGGSDSCAATENKCQPQCTIPESGAVTEPPTDLILNMLDPENGPAAGLPYKVHYLGPPRPPCEAERIDTVNALSKIDNPSSEDPEIHSILKLVQSVFQCPAALCALFDKQRVYISEQEGDVIPCGTFPWRWTLCGWSMAFKNPQVLVIQDTLEDARFRNNEKVTISPKVRFYCGAPLIASNGHRLGTLCFADVKPRKFDMASCVMMNNLSDLVVRQLEKDLMLRMREADYRALSSTYAQLQRAIDCIEHCVVLLDTGCPGWRVVYANAAWSKVTGMDRSGMVDRLLGDVLEACDGTRLPSSKHRQLAADLKGFEVPLVRLKERGAATTAFTARFRAAGKQVLDESVIPIGVPSFLQVTGGEDGASRYFFMTLDSPSKKRSAGFGSVCNSGSVLMTSLSSVQMEYVPGLELGPLLGRGSFGCVYCGQYYGTPVAVKVIDGDVKELVVPYVESAAHKEASIMADLRHPHVVNVLHVSVRMIPRAVVPEYAPVACTPGAKRASFDTVGACSSVTDSSTANVTTTLDNAVVVVPMPRDGPSACGSGATNTGATNTTTTSVDNNSSAAATTAPQLDVHPGFAIINLGPDAGELCAHPEDAEGCEEGEEEMASEERAAMQKACLPKWEALPCNSPAAQAAAAAAAAAGASNTKSSSYADAMSSSHHGVSQQQLALRQGQLGAGVGAGAWDLSTSNNLMSCSCPQTWIVMELCDRGCVQDAIDRGWLRSVPDELHSQANMAAVVATALEIASAMRFLHARDIIHGDLSGWNVMLTSSGATSKMGGRGFTAKVVDFGLARSLDIGSRITTKNYGTLTHMPPETLTSGTIHKPTDVYSFGVLLWQMYHGSRPWSGLTHAQIIMLVCTQGKQLLWDPNTPQDFRALAQACMAREPEERPIFDTIVSELEDLRDMYC